MVSSRRGTSIPLCWIFLSLTMGFVILRLAQGQPSVYFKANAPAVKSLPRIGRRSDLDTFPLPLSPSMNILPPQPPSQLDIPQGSYWSVENYLFRNDQQFKPSHSISGILDSLAAAAASQQQGQASSSALDMERISPNQIFWRKFIGDPEGSDNALMNGMDNPDKNIYRSRSRK